MISRVLPLLLMSSFAASAVAEGFPVYATVGASYSAVDGNADADPIESSDQVPPVEVAIDGLSFDDEDFGWSASLGYEFLPWFSVELGYLDLGTVESNNFEGAPSGFQEAELGAEAITLAAQFQYPVAEHLSVTWHLGVADAEFNAAGRTFTSRIRPPNVIEILEARYADPDDETGYFFGVGLSWQLAQKIEVEGRYSRRDMKVLKYDSFGIRLVGRL